ncbi:hypothetical protein Tco_0041757, partial [Tanacetum coccineum]
MRPIYSAKLKLLGPLALLSKPSISAIHLIYVVGRWINLWTPEDCQRLKLLNFGEVYTFGPCVLFLLSLIIKGLSIIAKLALVVSYEWKVGFGLGFDWGLTFLASALYSSDSRVRACLYKRICVFYTYQSSSTPIARPTGGFRADYEFVATLDDEIRRDPEREVGYGITDTWDEMIEGMSEAPATDETELGQRLTDFVTT